MPTLGDRPTKTACLFVSKSARNIAKYDRFAPASGAVVGFHGQETWSGQGSRPRSPRLAPWRRGAATRLLLDPRGAPNRPSARTRTGRPAEALGPPKHAETK